MRRELRAPFLLIAVCLASIVSPSQASFPGFFLSVMKAGAAILGGEKFDVAVKRITDDPFRPSFG